VRADSPIRSLKDANGKSIALSSTGSSIKHDRVASIKQFGSGRGHNAGYEAAGS
jgi:hypothetical protein